MKTLRKRLAKLEAVTSCLLEGPWLWPARAEAVRKRTMDAMTPEDLTLITESFGGDGRIGYSAFAESYPTVWVRYTEAFARATREVPAPYVMSIADLWGPW
jgi:hypothetical protein